MKKSSVVSGVWFVLLALFFNCTDKSSDSKPLPVPEVFAGNDTVVYILDTIQYTAAITNGVKPFAVAWYFADTGDTLLLLTDTTVLSYPAPSSPCVLSFIFQAENKDGEKGIDTVVVTVVDDTTFAVTAGNDTTVEIRTPLSLHGTVTSLLPVTATFWKIDSSDFMPAGTDTTIQSGDFADTIFCIFKAVNSKDAARIDTCIITVHDPHRIRLRGTVVNKDSSAAENVFVHLIGNSLTDTTDSNGLFEFFVIDSSHGLSCSAVTDSSDSLQISKDGQLIATLYIDDLSDSLSAIMIAHRKFAGIIDSSVSVFRAVTGVLWSGGDTSRTYFPFTYSIQNHGIYGTRYFYQDGVPRNFSLYVNIFNKDSVFTGRSDTVRFTSASGDISIPRIDPNNAMPKPKASADSTVVVNNMLYLRGTATDAFGGRIDKWEWDPGNTGAFIETTPDSNYLTVSPETIDSAYECVLRVTDDETNTVSDTVIIRIISSPPIAHAGNDTIVGFGDSLRLHGKATDDDSIVKWEWKTGNNSWTVTTTSDTVILTPASPQIMVCSLRVTDNSGETGMDGINIVIRKTQGALAYILAKDSSFLMGSNKGYSIEEPVHTVLFTRDFWIDTAEVCQGDYSSLMASAYPGYSNPAWASSQGIGDSFPAYYVNWYDAVLYCNALSKEAGLDTVYAYSSITGIPGNDCGLTGINANLSKNGFRLPTEAEWEYACRAGSVSEYFWGIDSVEAADYTWYSGNSSSKTHPTGAKKPNSLWLYDISGNVAEWCNDWYGSYGNGSVTDPTGPGAGTFLVTRGGHINAGAFNSRSAYRALFLSPNVTNNYTGFRVVRPVN